MNHGVAAEAGRPRMEPAVSVDPCDQRMRRLARRLGWQGAGPDGDAGIRLARDREGRYALHDRRGLRARPVMPDFARVPGGLAHGGRRAQPIARAVGTRAGTVVDATAGLGGDAWLLACLGYRVTAVERSALLALLLKAAARHRRTRPLPCIVPPRVIHGDARELLGTRIVAPDVVYIDTMFQQPAARTARPRRGMLLLRELVGDDDDAGELLAVALATARDRVVVKRARQSPTLDPAPAHVIRATVVRYDIYPLRAGAGAVGGSAP